MKNNTVEVIRAFVATEIDGITVENNFTSFQIIAGEQINLTGLPNDILLVPASNSTSLKPNMILLDEDDNYTVINGDAYFIAVDEQGNVISISDEQKETVLNWIIDQQYINIMNFNYEGWKETIY